MSTKDSAIEGGGECNILVLSLFALNIYDANIVINHGVEIKAKSPPLIFRFMFRRLKIDADGIFCEPTHYNFGHHVNVQFN